jgi:hypothetical protein
MSSSKPFLSKAGKLPSKIDRLHLLAVCLLITTSGALLQAQAQCTAPAGKEVICAPGSNATVTNPVRIVGASNLSPAATTTVIYIDFGTTAKIVVSGPSVDLTLTSPTPLAVPLAAGTHHLTVQSFNGVWAKASEFITVSSSTGGVSVSINPTSATLAPNGTQPFAATVSGSSNTSVTWSVDGVVGGNSTTGTISTSGLYTAPGAAGSHTVTATSVADTTKSASASVTVKSSTGCVATVDQTVKICSPQPNSTNMSPVQFTAAALDNEHPITAMKVYNGLGSTIAMSSGAQLSASVPMLIGTYKITVRAWDTTGAFFSSVETITVASAGTVSVSISPTSASLAPNATQQFTDTVSGSSNTSVTWSVDGVVGGNSTTGTISTSGLYTAPAATGGHTVTATSVADTTKSASASVTVGSSPPPGNVEVLTSKNDNARSGLNPNETVLNPTTVASAQFHKLGSWTLDGTMQAQPLYVPGVQINGSTFNVLYVATENDSVYALNADVPGSAPLWHRSFLGTGATIGTAWTGTSTAGNPSGITATPVIDSSKNRLYVIARTMESGNNVDRIHAIDITTGADAVPPVVVTGAVPGTGSTSSGGTLTFNANLQLQRPGLLLQNGVVYAAFGSFDDNTPYNGWLIAFDANSLQVLGAFAANPNGDGSAIWQSGSGVAADSSGAIYVSTANGQPYAAGGLLRPPTDLPDSIIKLAFNGSSFSVADFFTPFNQTCLTNDDIDLGSSGALIVPDGVAGKNMLVTGGKEGRIYLIDRNSLGKFNSSGDNVIQEILFNPGGSCGVGAFDANSSWRIYGAPSFWNGNVYVGSAFGPLRQYSVTSGGLQQVALGTFTYSASGQSGRGPIPVVSANGGSGGVVWTSWRDLSGNGWLHAYDASNVSHLLFSSNYGTGTVFTVPTVANGHVYVTGNNVVFAYGTQ